MARITVHAVHGDGEPRRWTLSERISSDDLASDHYASQLLERVRWATADAEGLETPSAPRDPGSAAEPDPEAAATAAPRPAAQPDPRPAAALDPRATAGGMVESSTV